MTEALYLSKLNVNGQEYQIKDANAVTPSKLEADLATKVGYAEYDSEIGNIVFYENEEKTSVLCEIDATDFIKDGMVSDVAISNGNLVITFNTDAGHNAISIPLTDIFNPANYYDKTAMDAALALKADASNVYTKSEADGKFLTEHQSLANYPTIETMNTALGQKANVSDIYTQTEIDNKLAAKADASNVYTKAEVDTQSETTAQALSNINTQLAAKANSADLATVATSGSYNDLSDKPVIPEGAVVDAALSDTSENPVQNKVVKGAIDAKQDVISDLATIRSGAEAGATAYQKPSTGIPASDIADGVIPTVPTNVSAFTNDAGYLTQHQSLADYYTKSEIDTSIGEINDDLDLKADASSVYTKLQADARWPYNTYVSVNGETLVITSSQLK